MEIFITRDSAFSIQCGGLDRLKVWFKKPIWVEPKYFDEESHFFSEREVGCHAPNGWGLYSGNFQSSVPVSAIFGFEGEISSFIWEKLKEHFGNTDFREWNVYEKENEFCNKKEFLLCMNINFSL